MTRRYVAFDLETAKVIPAATPDWSACRPLGISCAAALRYDDGIPLLFHGRTVDDRPAGQMSRDEAAGLVGTLSGMVREGYTLLTWNGLAFDFAILAEESGMQEECARLALEHVDLMFQLFCLLGYPISLESAALGMGLPAKPAGMSGAVVPAIWAAGKHAEVLDYVAQDVRTTLELALAGESRGRFHWLSKRGKRMDVKLPRGWLSVHEAEHLPAPDTSWMTNPIPRSRFADWIAP